MSETDKQSGTFDHVYRVMYRPQEGTFDEVYSTMYGGHAQLDKVSADFSGVYQHIYGPMLRDRDIKNVTVAVLPGIAVPERHGHRAQSSAKRIEHGMAAMNSAQHDAAMSGVVPLLEPPPLVSRAHLESLLRTRLTYTRGQNVVHVPPCANGKYCVMMTLFPPGTTPARPFVSYITPDEQRSAISGIPFAFTDRSCVMCIVNSVFSAAASRAFGSVSAIVPPFRVQTESKDGFPLSRVIPVSSAVSLVPVIAVNADLVVATNEEDGHYSLRFSDTYNKQVAAEAAISQAETRMDLAFANAVRAWPNF